MVPQNPKIYFFQENLKRSITSKVWSKLIRQNCPSLESGWLLGRYRVVERGQVAEEERLQEATIVVGKLASILKLMKKPKDLLLDLLDVICERVPSIEHMFGTGNQLQMACPRPLTLTVSHLLASFFWRKWRGSWGRQRKGSSP